MGAGLIGAGLPVGRAADRAQYRAMGSAM